MALASLLFGGRRTEGLEDSKVESVVSDYGGLDLENLWNPDPDLCQPRDC